jgi:hypothetical protein
MALLVLVLGRTLWHAFRRWRKSSARRHALAECSRIAKNWSDDGNVTQLAMQLSTLLRRTMLAYVARDEVASLTGEHWLLWLDRGLPLAPFSSGPGRSLASLPYRRDTGGDQGVDARALLAAVKSRLQTPLPEERS